MSGCLVFKRQDFYVPHFMWEVRRAPQRVRICWVQGPSTYLSRSLSAVAFVVYVEIQELLREAVYV